MSVHEGGKKWLGHHPQLTQNWDSSIDTKQQNVLTSVHGAETISFYLFIYLFIFFFFFFFLNFILFLNFT